MNELNVLVIEDKSLINNIIDSVLKKIGIINSFLAKSSEDAILIAEENKIDLVLSDIKIDGELDGIDTVKILQNLYSAPTIFVSTHKDNDTLLKLSNVRYSTFLLKPYRPDELEVQIKLAIIKNNLIKNENTFTKITKYRYYQYKNKLYLDDQIINLTQKENYFFLLLLNKKNTTIPYNIIDETIWINEPVTDNTRRTFFYRFKSKLNKLDLKVERNIGIGLFFN